jgi:hypothetical protein
MKLDNHVPEDLNIFKELVVKTNPKTGFPYRWITAAAFMVALHRRGGEADEKQIAADVAILLSVPSLAF